MTTTRTRRSTATQTTERDTARTCRELHSEIDKFLDWAGYSHCRKRLEWRTWGSQQILQGWTTDACMQHLRDAWYAHCSSTGRRPKAEQSDNRRGLAALLANICTSLL